MLIEIPDTPAYPGVVGNYAPDDIRENLSVRGCIYRWEFIHDLLDHGYTRDDAESAYARAVALRERHLVAWNKFIVAREELMGSVIELEVDADRLSKF